jgi:hypothetical protein
MSPTAIRQNELLDQLAAGEADRARGFARRQRLLAELADLAHREAGATGVEQFAAMEVAGTCRKGRMAAQFDLADAARYGEALPLTLELLDRGELYEHQARVLLKTTENCSEDVARAVEARVLGAGGKELSPPDLRQALKRAVLQVESELDAEAVTARLAEARAKRRVTSRAEDDGMASIHLLGSAEQVRQHDLDLDQLVLQEKRADREAGVWRSSDQIRADLMLAMPGMLLRSRQDTGGARAVPRADALVNVFVPVLTALERSSEPGEIDGYGPISAEHVRLLMPHSRLRRACVDSTTGRLLELDDVVQAPAEDTVRTRLLDMLRPSVVTHEAEPQHDPSALLRRFVDLRSRRCDGINCSHPARRCHKDHRVPYPAGPTSENNLDPRSASCHRAKHSGWQVRIEQDGGTTWTSPLGRTYRRPPPYEPPVLPPAPRWEPLRRDENDGEAA